MLCRACSVQVAKINETVWHDALCYKYQLCFSEKVINSLAVITIDCIFRIEIPVIHGVH